MHILAIGPIRAGHHRLYDLGHTIVSFVPGGKIKSENISTSYDNILVLDDYSNINLWIDAAIAYHINNPFDRIVAFNDAAYFVVNAISNKLNIQTVVDIALFEKVSNKAKMREILDKHCIPSCKYFFAKGKKSVLDAIKNIGFPCIVKPIDSEASTCIAKITSINQIENALDWVSSYHVERGVIIEEFLIGDEFSIEAISIKNKHYIIAITKKFKNKDTFVELGHLVPAPLSITESDLIKEYVITILDTFNFHDCPSHTELVLTMNGPRIIETHNRYGGDKIMDLVEYSTGIDMYNIIARQSIGENIVSFLPPYIDYGQNAMICYATPSIPESLKLIEVLGINEIRGLNYVKALELLKKPGSKGSVVRMSSDRSCFIIVVGNNADETQTRGWGAIKLLEFRYSYCVKD